MKFKRFVLAAALVLSCGAVVGSAIAAPVTYKIDPNHTNVLASWSHVGFSHPVANFGKADGVIVYDAKDIGASSVQVTLPLSGLSAFAEDFTEHLQSSDFFDLEKFPAATFKSTKVQSAPGGKLKITGDLTIKGITKSVVLDTVLNKVGVSERGKPRIGFDATTALKRTDFDLGLYAPNVGDEVKITITTEALGAAPAAEAKH